MGLFQCWRLLGYRLCYPAVWGQYVQVLTQVKSCYNKTKKLLEYFVCLVFDLLALQFCIFPYLIGLELGG